MLAAARGMEPAVVDAALPGGANDLGDDQLLLLLIHKRVSGHWLAGLALGQPSRLRVRVCPGWGRLCFLGCCVAREGLCLSRAMGRRTAAWTSAGTAGGWAQQLLKRARCFATRLACLTTPSICTPHAWLLACGAAASFPSASPPSPSHLPLVPLSAGLAGLVLPWGHPAPPEAPARPPTAAAAAARRPRAGDLPAAAPSHWWAAAHGAARAARRPGGTPCSQWGPGDWHSAKH